ncbi:hypothetical protein BV898_03256 [Hypsibius exemplaris]|uniref:Receptor ligand binding region domain-containing protein n=1 Tax=Hypsibius exemplaris TaxID=2072580 RepID=A0A1W0X678_HYPEX|nr:hypothetical protein BV898_03256 [Hypsibius exemplaris]
MFGVLRDVTVFFACSKTISRIFNVFFSFAFSSSVAAFDLELISTIPYNISLGVALPWTGAGLDLGQESVRRRYASSGLNLTVTFLYRPEDRSCDDANANAMLLLTEYYNRRAANRCVAIISSACGGHALTPYLAREWNVLLFTNSLVTNAAINPQSTPTAIGMAGTYDGFALALFKLFRYFGWFHVTLLQDSSAATEFYWETFKAVPSLAARSEYSNFTIDGFRFNISELQTVKDAVSMAAQRSRIFVILANTAVVIRLLRTAKENGIIVPRDYVFIVFQPLRQAVYGSITLFDNAADKDLDLFDSVIFLTTYGGVKSNGSDALEERILERQRNGYRTILEPGIKPLDLFSIRETYNSVELFAALVNETFAYNHDHSVSATRMCDGRKLLDSTLNRTFQFLSGLVDIHADGSRYADLLLFTFDKQLRTMQVAARYNSSTEKYVWSLNQTGANFTIGQVSDVPACGFAGLDGPCQARNDLMVRLVVPLACLALVLGPIVIFVLYRIKQLTGWDDLWWVLSETGLGASNIIHNAKSEWIRR